MVVESIPDAPWRQPAEDQPSPPPSPSADAGGAESQSLRARSQQACSQATQACNRAKHGIKTNLKRLNTEGLADFKAQRARRKATAKAAKKQLWQYRYDYAKVYMRQRQAMLSIAMKKSLVTARKAQKRVVRAAWKFPNPLENPHERDEEKDASLIGDQYLSRALRLRDRGSIVRIVSGWLLNYILLFYLLYLSTVHSCELAAYDAAATSFSNATGTVMLAWTWACSLLLRKCLIEPLVVIASLFFPWFLSTYCKKLRTTRHNRVTPL